MKKTILLLWLSAFVICLYAQDDTRRNSSDGSSGRLTHVTMTQAQDVGFTFLRSSDGTRSGALQRQDMQLIYTGVATDSITGAPIDCYYVFSLQPTGFVIVAADERVKPILGYSYTNNFVVDDMPINVTSWLDNYKKQIKAVVDNDYQADSETRTKWIRLKAGQTLNDRSSSFVNPLLQTTWNQNCYYNLLSPADPSGPCGHAYAGCVATAMAQVMRYWEWPNQGFNSHSYTCNYGTLSVDFSEATYNYDNMPNAVSSSTNATHKEEVAKLIYHCGVAVDMDFDPDGSGAYSSDVPAALYNYFAYTDNGTYVSKSSYSESGWANLIKQELDNMRPVYYSGHGSGGHAFVCDGYDENGLFHFNWGWSGSSDGYFDLSALNPSTHDYSSSQAAVIGIKSAGTFMRCSQTELSFSARVGEQSAVQTIMVSGHGLSGSISVTVGNGFKVSRTGLFYYTSLTLPASGGKLYVKYIPTQSGDVTGTLTLTSGNYSLEVTLNGTDNVIIGSGTATSNYLPSHSYYKYALTQQIYTPEEIGTSGYINSISFFNDGTEKTRNYNMYLVLTDKETFTSNTDWIPVTEDDRVFSGAVTMAAGAWTVFNINNFAYDGVSNLALIMDDNTGSYSSGMACRVFNADDKSLYIYSDGTNYDPANPYSYNGTVLDQKNQIKIGITPANVVICEKPSNLTFSNLTSTSVSVSWSGGSGAFGYEYKKSTDSEWTVACAGNCGYNCNLSGLSSNTSYQFRVRSFCTSDTSNWLTSSFSTPAGIPLVEPFNNSSIPTGWSLYTGLMGNVMAGTAPLASATSGWSFGTSNGVFDSHARTNIYGTSWNKWLVTPTLLMDDNVELSFDLALTKYSGNLQPVVDTLQQDDVFAVLITTNGGSSWTVLRQWDNTGSEYVYNNIVCSATGENVKIKLSSYAGQNIAVAFYGESTASGGDNNLHIDNVSIDYITSCERPTAVNVSNITAQSATVSWESEADRWMICLNNNEDNSFIAESIPFTLTGLTPETPYTVQVRAFCNGEKSNWSQVKSFTTTIACPAPTNLTCTSTTTTSAILSWSAGEASAWQLCLNNDMENLINVHTTTYTLTGLNPSTSYSIKVRAICDSAGPWSNVLNFNTVFAIPLVEPFNNSSIPTGWSLYTGLMDNVMAGTVSLAPATSGWTFGPKNGVFDSHARTNIYGSSWNKWLVTPSLLMEENVQLSFDLSLTKYSGTLLPVSDSLQQDDKFVVLITTDGGAHWQTLRQWDNAGSEYVYNHIVCSAEGEPVTIDLSGYAGQDIAIAFYGESTVANGDNNLHIDNVSIDYIPESCYTIPLNADEPVWTENFDSYTQSLTTATGEEPICWMLVQEDVTMPDNKRPQIYCKSSFAHSGRYSLMMNYRGVYAMPALSEDVAVQNVKLEMYLRQANAAYQLQVGVWDDAEGTFSPVALFNNETTGVELVTCDFSGYNGNGRRIAFRNVLGNGANYNYSYNYLDDITLTLKGTEACAITLPYNETFEGYTAETGATGVEPDCWELVQEDVAMTATTTPQLYQKASYAHSGNYSLRMYNRGVYAMPMLSEDVDINQVKLELYVRQPNKCYQLHIGVWDDETETFEPVAVVNNSTTDVTYFTCDFSGYAGEGRRIAFRNTLNSGAAYNYSYNYIDDISLSVIEPSNSCDGHISTLPYEDNFESYTLVTTASTGVEPDCWELVREDVALTDATRPQLYYKSSFAHSGNYSLKMGYRCVYAMPTLPENVNISDLQLSMYLRQANAAYRLEVGVWDDEMQTFEAVQLFNNSTTNVEQVSCDFSSYTGNGHRIAFRNVLADGAHYAYSYNYLDDITLSYTDNTRNAATNDNNSNGTGIGHLLESVSVYPNPTRDFINVQCTMNNVHCSGIEMIDVYGNVVYMVGASDTCAPVRINVSNLAAGMYFVRVTTDQGAVTKTFVKK